MQWFNWSTAQKVQIPILLLNLACAIVVIIEACAIPQVKLFVGDTNLLSEESTFEYVIPTSRNLGIAFAVPIFIITVPNVAGLFLHQSSSHIFYTLNVVLVSLASIELTVVWIWTAVYMSMTSKLCNYCYTCADNTASSTCQTNAFPLSCWDYQATNTYVCNTFEPTLIAMFSFMIIGFAFVVVNAVLSCVILNAFKKEQDISVISHTVTTGGAQQQGQQVQYIQTDGGGGMIMQQAGGGMLIQQGGMIMMSNGGGQGGTYIVQS